MQAVVASGEILDGTVPVVVILTFIGVTGVVGVEEALVVSEADEGLHLPPVMVAPGTPYVAVAEAHAPALALPCIFGIEAEVVEVGMTIGRQVMPCMSSPLVEVAACLEASVEHLEVEVATVGLPPGESIVGQQAPALAEVEFRAHVEGGTCVVEQVGAHADKRLAGGVLDAGRTLLQYHGKLHLQRCRLVDASHRGGDVEVDDTEHRVTYAGIIGLQQVAVDGLLLHAPLFGGDADGVVVDDAEHLVDGLLLHALVLHHIIAQALPRLTVGVHEEAVAQLGVAALDGLAHRGGTAARELDVMFIHTLG